MSFAKGMNTFFDEKKKLDTLQRREIFLQNKLQTHLPKRYQYARRIKITTRHQLNVQFGQNRKTGVDHNQTTSLRYQARALHFGQ